MNYIYPKNLNASAQLWLWSMKDFVIIGIGTLLSVFILVNTRMLLPAAITMCYAFLTIRADEETILDYLKYAVSFFLTSQQYFEWRIENE